MVSRLIIALVLVLAVPAAFAEQDAATGKKFFYEWTDQQGGVHIADALSKVPEEYRSQVRKIEEPKQETTGVQAQQPQPEPSPAANSDIRDAAMKAQWQERIKEWKDKLSDAEKRYHELEQERSKIYTGAFAWPGNKVKADEIEQKMTAVSQEIAKAKDMIQNVIPEEARKAGVPPGWLRELNSETP